MLTVRPPVYHYNVTRKLNKWGRSITLPQKNTQNPGKPIGGNFSQIQKTDKRINQHRKNINTLKKYIRLMKKKKTSLHTYRKKWDTQQ